jgi:hypothetical protein
VGHGKTSRHCGQFSTPQKEKTWTVLCVVMRLDRLTRDTARSVLVAAVKISMLLVWVATSLDLKMEAVCSSETLLQRVTTQKINIGNVVLCISQGFPSALCLNVQRSFL